MIREDENLVSTGEGGRSRSGNKYPRVFKDHEWKLLESLHSMRHDVTNHIFMCYLCVYNVCSHMYAGRYIVRHAKSMSLSALFP